MKKALLFSIIVISLVSCSSNDETPEIQITDPIANEYRLLGLQQGNETINLESCTLNTTLNILPLSFGSSYELYGQTTSSDCGVTFESEITWSLTESGYLIESTIAFLEGSGVPNTAATGVLNDNTLTLSFQHQGTDYKLTFRKTNLR